MKVEKFLGYLVFLVAGIVLLAMAWRLPGVADWYIANIFPVWLNTYGRLTALAPISVGEIMLYAAVLFVALTAVVWVLRIVFALLGSAKLKKANRFLWVSLCKLLVIVFVIQVLNCFMLYQTKTIADDTVYSVYEPSGAEIIDLYNRLVNRANELCHTFERDENGAIIYDGDLKEAAVSAMQKLGKEAKERVDSGVGSDWDMSLQRLSGFYSKPKELYTSAFFSQQYICGYYFPFSLEANINNMMYIAYYPYTMCHELSHLKGFILEDEANFLSYLACINSGDDFFEYSAVIHILDYVTDDLNELLAVSPQYFENVSLAATDDIVERDDIFLTDEAWKTVEAQSPLDTETVSQASDEFVETNLKLNGVEDGAMSYSRVVDLLLAYYYGN